MTIKQMECFLSLANTLNFSKTAQQIYTTQPTVTRQIQALEQELGVQLFLRSSKGVHLTPAGESFKNSLSHIYEELEAAIQSVRNLDQNYSTCLEIGLCNLSSFPAISKVLQCFKEQHPGIKIHINILPVDQLNIMFNNYGLDIIFCMRNAVTGSNGADMRVLYKGYFVCHISENDPLSKKEVLTAKDIASRPWIFKNPYQHPAIIKNMQDAMMELCPEAQVTYTDKNDACTIMVNAGLGVNIAPHYSIEPHAGISRVRFIPPDSIDQRDIDYMVLWRRNDKRGNVDHFVNLACRIQKQLYKETEALK